MLGMCDLPPILLEKSRFLCPEHVNILSVTLIIVNRGHIPVNILHESGISETIPQKMLPEVDVVRFSKIVP